MKDKIKEELDEYLEFDSNILFNNTEFEINKETYEIKFPNIDTKSGKATRVGYRMEKNEKVRFSKKSNEVI
jgi:large subunit ribosomal protein L24